MGATASSALRDAPDDKLLHRNGEISSLHLNTNKADEGTQHPEQRPLADVCSGFVTLKDEAMEDLQCVVSSQPNTKNEDGDIMNADGVTVKEETIEMKEVNKINEVGLKKVFRFVGFKFTLKKDTCEKTEGEGPRADDEEENVASTSEDSSVTKEKSIVAADETSLFEKTPYELLKSQMSVQPEAPELSQKPETATELDHSTRTKEREITAEKGPANVGETSPESEEPVSPIKHFFTQGIFGSLRKKKKDETPKETREEELPIIDQTGSIKEPEGAETVDSKCMCLDIPYITYEEKKDSQLKGGSKSLPEGHLQNSLETDKIQGSPLKRLFRRFSTKRQRESKAAENVIDSGENIIKQPKSSLGFTEVQKAEKPVAVEPTTALEEEVADFSPQESQKKSDSTVSWEALICGSSAKKRARKTNEGETSDKGEEQEKTESPLGSSTESNYDHLTSSHEQDGEGEAGSTWKTFKKKVSPKRRIRTGGSSSSEHIPLDGEINKGDSFTMKKLMPGLRKKTSDGRQDQMSSDEMATDAETGDEVNVSPANIPLSEYEIFEPESVKEVNEELHKITIEHETPELTSQGLKQDTSNDSESKLSVKVSNNPEPLIIPVLSEDYEELTDYMSKHQQLSDIPEEGIMEESIETPVSSAEWTTQDDSLADAVTAPEPASGELTGDISTEMVSAVSQLTESPRTSGHVTPVSPEYGIQMSNMILQEAVESICMTPRAEFTTTKDESHESLVVSFSPYIIQSTAPTETKILVAHMKTEATAIYTGLVSQEMESVEELHSALVLEALPEVSDAVLTELVTVNLAEALEAADLGTDEVYEANIWEVKTECQEVIRTGQEVAIETELDEEQVIHVTPVLHVVDKNEACVTEAVSAAELRSVEMALTDTMEKYTYGHPEGPLHSVLVEPENGQPVQYSEVPAEAETEMEVTDATESEDKVNIEKVQLMHDVVSKIQETNLNTALESVPEVNSAAFSAVNMQEIVQQEIQDIPAEQSREVNASLTSQDAAETLTKVQLKEQLGITSSEVSLPEKALVEETENGHDLTAELHEAREMDVSVDNVKVEESAGEEADSSSAEEKEKLVGKEEELFTNTESDEAENQGVSALTDSSMTSPEIIIQDTKYSQERFKNDQPVTTVAITENQTKQKPNEVHPVVQGPEISELQKATEQEEDTSTMIEISAETICVHQVDQASLMTATETKVSAVPEQKDKNSVVTELEPENSTVIETVMEVSESIIVGHNDAAVQINNKNVSEQKDEEKGETRQKCARLEHLIKEPLEIELHIEEAPPVTHLTEEASAVSTPELTAIEQLPLTSEMKAATPEVSVPEIQKQEAIELRVATIEMTEPESEKLVVSDVPVETAAVTSVVTMTSSLSQNSDVDTVIEMPDLTLVLTPTVGSVVMDPATVETPDVVLVTEAIPAVTQIPEPVVTPLVETLVLVTVTEAVSPVSQTSFVSPAVELPAVEPPAVILFATAVVETPDLVSVMPTEAASPAVTLAVTAGAQTSGMSLVETPDFTAVVQTPPLVSLAAHSVATSTVTAAVETSVMETPSNSTADTPVSPVLVTLPDVSVRKTAAEEKLGVDGLFDTFVGTSVPEASQVTVFVTSALSPVIPADSVIPVIKETTLQVVEQEEKEIKTEVQSPLVTEKELKTPGLTEECFSDKENVKGFHQEVSLVTLEPQSEVEDDVWEDAVDNIGDDLMTQMDTDANRDSVV